MLKLVFVDMDGTFLNSAKKITPENLAAMDLAAQRGVQFVPCTGRNVNGIPEQMVSHPSVNYAVCCNGALVCDVHTGSVLHEVGIDKETVRALYHQVEDLPVTFDIFADSKVYTWPTAGTTWTRCALTRLPAPSSSPSVCPLTARSTSCSPPAEPSAA